MRISVYDGMKSAAYKLMLLGVAAAWTVSPVQAEPYVQSGDGLASTEKTDLKTLTCWDVVTLAEDDRAYTMALLYGYVIGAKGHSVIAPQDIQVAIVNSMMKCVDTPDEKVMDVLTEQMSH